MFKATALAPPFSQYANPVARGDFPDPSVVRVGERDFYAVTTSTEWAPHFPLLHSTDLVNWTTVGAVFDVRPSWAVGQFWAPEISYRDGRYCLYYTARRQRGPLTIAVASAAHPTGPWTDHGPLIGQSTGSIDATTAIENGRPWLIWKEDGNAWGRPTTLWAQALTADGRALDGVRHAILCNDQPWEDCVVEAPCIVEHDGWFVMFYSGNRCCGESCRYAVGVARARSIAGPWMKHPRNPIMAENGAFRGPGHGSCVSTADGRMFYLYHAYQNVNGATSVGRQLMLDEMTWDADGWPALNGGDGPTQRARAPFGRRAPDRGRVFSTDFRRALDASWQWPQHIDRPAQHRRERGELIVQAGRNRNRPITGVFGRRVRSLDYTATAVVSVAGTDRGALASLAAYGNGANALGIGVRDGRMIAWSLRAGAWTETDLGQTPAGKHVHLRLYAVWGKAYSLAFGVDGRRWSQPVDVLDGSHLPPWDRGVRIALCAAGAEGKRATFLRLRIADSQRRATTCSAR